MMIALMLACGTAEEDTAAMNDSAAESAEFEGSADAGQEPGQSPMIQDYVHSYCSDYAMECGLYSDVQTCEDILGDSLERSCTVVDEDALWECSLWLSQLSCGDDEAWLSTCDAAISCE